MSEQVPEWNPGVKIQTLGKKKQGPQNKVGTLVNNNVSVLAQ